MPKMRLHPLDDDFPFKVEVVDEFGHRREIVRATNQIIAHAALEAAAKEYPRYTVMLRTGVRLIAEKTPT